MGDRIVMRRCSTVVPSTEFPHPGEPFVDMDNNRFGVGYGDGQPRWYMGINLDGDWFTATSRFTNNLGDSYGFTGKGEWSLKINNVDFLIGNALGLQVKGDIIGSGDVYGKKGTFTDTVKVGSLESTGTSILRGETVFLGPLNLSLSDIAKGVIPQSFTAGDILIAGSGPGGSHAWQNTKVLAQNSELGGAILSNDTPGIHLKSSTGRFAATADGYPIKGIAAVTLDDLVANLAGASYIRASTVGHFNADGNFKQTAINRSRVNFNFSTYEKEGLALEGPSRNGIISSAVYGNAKVGNVTGGSQTGSLPDGWGLSNLPANAIIDVVSLDTFRGLPSIIIRIRGSNSTGSVINSRISFVSGLAQATTPGSKWTGSVYSSIETAVQPPDLLTLRIGTTNNTGDQVDAPTTSDNILLTGGVIKQFFTPPVTSTVNSYITAYLTWPVNNAQVLDFSVRIMLPVAENLPYTSFPYFDPVKAGDLLTLPATPRYFRPTEGTVLIHFKPFVVTGNPYTDSPVLWRANLDTLNSSQANMMQLIQIENKLKYQVFSSGALIVNLELGTIVAGNTYKVAITYKTDNFSAILSGNSIQVDTVGTVPLVAAQWIASDGTGKWLPMSLYEFKLIRRKLSDSELTSLVA